MSDRDLKLQVIFSMMEKVTAPLKKIIGTSESGGKALKAMRDKLKDLESQQVAVSGFRKIHGDLRETSSKLETAEQHVKSLAQKMRLVEAPTRAMTREFDKATKAAKQLKEQHQSQSLQLQGMRDKLKAAGISTNDLGKAQQWLKNNIAYTNAEITDQVKRLEQAARKQEQLAAAKKRMQATQAVAGKMAMTGAAMLATGAAGAATLKAPISAYANAEDSKIQLKVSMMQEGGKVSPEFEKINELAMRLGDRLPGTTADFLDMMTMLNRQGISGKSILGGMGEASAFLAVQLKKLPTEAAEFAAKMQDATRTSEKDMLQLMDVIQRTYYLGVDDNNMLEAFTRISPALRTLRKEGLEAVKEVAPLVTMFDQAGMKGESGGNALRKVLDLGMDKEKRDKVNKILAPKGIKLDFSDGKGEFAGLDAMFAQFAKLKDLNREEMIKALSTQFGDDGETQQVLGILIDKGKAGYNETLQKMNSQASLQTRVNEQLGTLKNLWEATTGTFTNTLVAFGESISPELKSLTTWLGDVAQATGKWSRENPVLSGYLMKTIAIVTLLLVGLGGLALVVSALLGPFAILRFALGAAGMQAGIFSTGMKLVRSGLGIASTALRMFGSAFMSLGRLMMANPIGLAIMAIAAAVYLVYRYWEPISNFFSGIWSRIKAFFNSGIENISATITNWSPLGLFYQCFAAVANYFGIELPAKFTEFGSMVIDGLINGISNKALALKKTVTDIGTSMGDWFAEKLGIKSPSRVFMQLGIHTMDGLDVGLNKGRNKPLTMLDLLSDKMRAIGFGLSMAVIAPAATAFDQTMPGGTNPSIPALTPFKFDSRPPLSMNNSTRSNAQHMGDTINISIAPTPGMDSQAIARAVAAELDKRDRQRQHSKRSSLHDYDEF
nr:phage tail tape measure protein [uncultured Undibacterium sp.]